MKIKLKKIFFLNLESLFPPVDELHKESNWTQRF